MVLRRDQTYRCERKGDAVAGTTAFGVETREVIISLDSVNRNYAQVGAISDRSLLDEAPRTEELMMGLSRHRQNCNGGGATRMRITRQISYRVRYFAWTRLPPA